jgi:hypothetical protein
VCDGDYNNDGIVGVPDLNLLAQIFGTGANADMECADVIPGGFVIWLDDYMNCWLTQLGGAPGP